MTNNEIVDMIEKEGMLRSIIDHVTQFGKEAKDPGSLCDLMQDIYLSLLQDERLQEVYEEDHLRYYLARIVVNNIKSSTSPYYRYYIRPRQMAVPIDEKIKNRA